MKRLAPKNASLGDLSAQYEEAAGLHGEASRTGNSRAANAQYKRIVAAWKELRGKGEAGRAVLLHLMGNSNPDVRLWAASHVLEFDPGAAEAELNRLASGPPSLVRFDAELTLKEWRAGNLTFPDT